MKTQGFLIIAPAGLDARDSFPEACIDDGLHSEMLKRIHSLREYALREATGSNQSIGATVRRFRDLDRLSWNVALQAPSGHVVGCARYRPIDGGFDQFRASESAIARSTRYGPMLKTSLERLLSSTRHRGKHYGEAGGWALCPDVRKTTAGFNVALMTYALAEHLGSGLALTTATRLNQSASILRRIGARTLPGLPGYYEPEFASVMEIIHFNLPCLNAVYAAKLKAIRQVLSNIRVICSAVPVPVPV